MQSPCLQRLVRPEKAVVWTADYEHGKQAQTMMKGLQAIGLKAANMPRQVEHSNDKHILPHYCSVHDAQSMSCSFDDETALHDH